MSLFLKILLSVPGKSWTEERGSASNEMGIIPAVYLLSEEFKAKLTSSLVLS